MQEVRQQRAGWLLPGWLPLGCHRDGGHCGDRKRSWSDAVLAAELRCRIRRSLRKQVGPVADALTGIYATDPAYGENCRTSRKLMAFQNMIMSRQLPKYWLGIRTFARDGGSCASTIL